MPASSTGPRRNRALERRLLATVAESRRIRQEIAARETRDDLLERRIASAFSRRLSPRASQVRHSVRH